MEEQKILSEYRALSIQNRNMVHQLCLVMAESEAKERRWKALYKGLKDALLDAGSSDYCLGIMKALTLMVELE